MYNVGPYIKDCVSSVMHQTYEGPMECLIVDDCGTDESIPVAERMLLEYDGPIVFRVLHHAFNKGISAARNTGLVTARGDYLFFLDSDDELLADSIKTLVDAVSRDRSIEIVQGNAKTLPDRSPDRFTKSYSQLHVTSNREVRKSYFQYRQFIHNAWNKLIKRSFLLNNHLMFREGIVFEDFLWSFYVLKPLTNVCFVPEITYLYKKHEGSIMTSTDKVTMAKSDRIIYQEILDNPTFNCEKEEFQWYLRRFSHYYIYNNTLEYDELFHLFWERALKFVSPLGLLRLIRSRIFRLVRQYQMRFL